MRPAEAALRTAAGNTLKNKHIMKTISVKATKRAEFGKKAAKAVRREGFIPCVLCGNGETEMFSVDPREIKPLIYTPNSYIVEFDVEGKKELAVLREAQFHPVREEILHMDFYRIADGNPVSIAIPVRLTGNAEGVKVGGTLAISSGSTIERTGKSEASPTKAFSKVSSLVMTPELSVSEPVPAVVVMATMGSGRTAIGLPLPEPMGT